MGCKYTQEKTKIENYINEDLKDSESDSESNNEIESDIDNGEYSVKSILIIIIKA